MFTPTASRMSSGSDNLSNTRKVQSISSPSGDFAYLDVLDTSKWPKKTGVLGINRYVIWLKDWMCVCVCVSVVQSMDCVNILLVGTVTAFVANLSHLQQL